jgi:hypothetical protein
MTMCPTVCLTFSTCNATCTMLTMKSVLTCSICSSIKLHGAPTKRTRTIQRVVSTLITLEISEDLPSCLDMSLRTVTRLLRVSGKILINNFNSWDKCDKGLKCTKCHTTVERLYHPDKYKRIFCDVRYYHS